MHSFLTITGLSIAFACGCLAPVPAAGELYKWTDADGKVHYSDQPPPSNVKQPITVKPRGPAPATPAAESEAEGMPPAGPKTYVEENAEFNRRRVEAAEREAAEKKAAKDAAEKKKSCEEAKSQLARTQSGVRMTRYNDKGEIVYLSDAEIAQEIARTKQVADSWCK